MESEDFGVSDESAVQYRVVTFGGGQRLREILEYSQNELMPIFKDYRWHREAFNLNFFIDRGTACLYGSTDIGVCLEDEWVIVYLLKKLSEKFSDVWIQVTDTDGEFLLIEAANVLPKWLIPEISDNRIWINQSNICIIPDNEFAEIAPTFREAVEYLKLGGEMYHDEKVNSEAFNRIKDYPKTAIENSTHRVFVTVPRKVAGVLNKYPFYLSAALELFNSRSVEDEKIVKKRTIFPALDPVECTVRFTRLQYAHILGQKFDNDGNDSDDEQVKLGNKISAALELLYADSLSRNYLTDENVYDEPAFKEFLHELAKDGYFMGEIPGTEKYNDFRDLAVQPYLDSTRFENDKGLFIQRVRELKEPSDQEIYRWDKTVDSDEWMDAYLHPSEEEKYDTEEKMNARVEDMLKKVQNFMNDESAGLDGVNYYEEAASSTSSSSDNDNDDDSEEELFGRDDPKIDEDDFLEFFLKEAMKLSPEEIESYRADAQQKAPQSESSSHDADNEEAPDDEDLYAMEEELKKAGVLSEEGSAPDYKMLANLLESIKSGGGVTGPAATLLGQLGMPVPRPEDFEAD